MGGTERLHHRDGLLQFAEACHVEPHERSATVSEHRLLTLVPDGDTCLGPAVLAKRQQTQQQGPQDTPQTQQQQRHQYQYSFEARL